MYSQTGTNVAGSNDLEEAKESAHDYDQRVDSPTNGTTLENHRILNTETGETLSKLIIKKQKNEKTLLVCLLAFVFCGCFEVHDDTSNHEIDRIPCKVHRKYNHSELYLQNYIVKIDGDEYIIMDGVERAGFVRMRLEEKKKERCLNGQVLL